ncbi:uncharacterized protein CELE_C08E8.10 [Caenorhabditis elegans]|uniref:Uncharacterized protein n=1 Tax=Caenorhabditis elegans TaxID=6239 RepID=B2D6P7_CAEEL|nr:Uncharacterized protein CELE_C08E8.10 [Caenorhabditis elegans]CAQ35016.1 Uncharacterized protein CELE_C08E8.10 [Caenorhabditis elegans]|eukprot:NP_001122842.1 Uncharacterized protein CELE_C08E8.10 [Caenorhabditis elegans]
MKIPQAIAEIVSEFSGINRSPNAPLKCTPSSRKCSMATPPTSTTSSACNSGASSPRRKLSEPAQRKHSVVIAVGVSPIQTCTIDPKLLNKNFD